MRFEGCQSVLVYVHLLNGIPLNCMRLVISDEIVKDFGYDLEVGDNAYQFSISMEFVSNSHRKERANITTDILYVVTGSAHLVSPFGCF